MRVPILTYHSNNVSGNDYASNDHVALAADLRGNRPGFSTAAPPAEGERLYLKFSEALRAEGVEAAQVVEDDTALPGIAVIMVGREGGELGREREGDERGKRALLHGLSPVCRGQAGLPACGSAVWRRA